MHEHGSVAAARRRGLLLVGGAATLWGTSGLTATVAYGRGVDPLTVSAWRMAVGAVVLLLALRVGSRRPADSTRVTIRALRRTERFSLAVVTLGLAGYQMCYFIAVERAGVGIATLITLGSAPLLVTLGERLFTRRPTGRATSIGIGLALVGLVALVGTPGAAGPEALTGALFAGGSALGYATVTLVGSGLGTRLGAERLTIATFAGAALVLLPLAALTAGLGIDGDVLVFGALAYLGIVPTAVAYRLFFTGLPAIRATHAAVLVLLEPLVATGLAMVVLEERLGPLGLAGAVLLVGAVVLVTRARR